MTDKQKIKIATKIKLHYCANEAWFMVEITKKTARRLVAESDSYEQKKVHVYYPGPSGSELIIDDTVWARRND